MYGDDFPNLPDLERELRCLKSIADGHAMLQGLTTAPELAQAMVKANVTPNFPNMFRLLKLVLTIQVSTATTERSFSALKIIKTRLRTSIGDPWMSDLLILMVEKELCPKTEDVLQKFIELHLRRINMHY
jgi:hypothetical protein